MSTSDAGVVHVAPDVRLHHAEEVGADGAAKVARAVDQSDRRARDRRREDFAGQRPERAETSEEGADRDGQADHQRQCASIRHLQDDQRQAGGRGGGDHVPFALAQPVGADGDRHHRQDAEQGRKGGQHSDDADREAAFLERGRQPEVHAPFRHQGEEIVEHEQEHARMHESREPVSADLDCGLLFGRECRDEPRALVLRQPAGVLGTVVDRVPPHQCPHKSGRRFDHEHPAPVGIRQDQARDGAGDHRTDGQAEQK